MKYFILVLSMVCTLQCLAQDPILYQHTWYLHELIVDGENITLPSTENIPLFFDEDFPNEHNFRTWVCTDAYGEVIYDDPNSTFSFIPPLFICCFLCEPGSELEIFQEKYFGFYQNEIDFPFVYEIYIIDNSEFGLVITSESGNIASYGDKILAVNEKELIDISLYPNPSSSRIFIKSLSEPVTKVELYNILGQKVNALNQDFEWVDVSGLTSGMYLMKIYTEGGMAVKRIIKK